MREGFEETMTRLSILALCLYVSVAHAQVTFSGNVTSSGSANLGVGTIYASEGCEAGTVQSPWTVSNGDRVSCSTEQVKTGTYSVKIHYETSGVGHQSDDQYIVYDKGAPGIFAFYVRMWIRLKTPALTPATGDKIAYMSAGTFDGSDPWSIIYTMDDPTVDGWPGDGPVFMRFSLQNGNIGGDTYASDCGTSDPPPITGLGCNIQYDMWYMVEMYIQSNTAASAPWNGIIKIWLTPSGGSTELVYDTSTWSLNRTTTGYIRMIRLGEQVDTDGVASDQDRYIDDVVVASFGVSALLMPWTREYEWARLVGLPDGLMGIFAPLRAARVFR